MKKHIFRVITTVAILISYGAFSQSEYYVSGSLGSDSNAGTESAPFQSINKGISMLNPGDTVYVMEGVYTNNNFGTVDPSTNTNMSNPHVVTVNKSGTEDAYITLRNYPCHTPKIKFDGRGGIIISNNMNYIIIEGFEVEGPSQDIDYSMAIADREYKILCAEDGDSSTNYNNAYFGGKGIWGGYGAHKHVIIRNNIVHDTPGSAIRFNDSDYITIEDNIVYNQEGSAFKTFCNRIPCLHPQFAYHSIEQLNNARGPVELDWELTIPILQLDKTDIQLIGKYYIDVLALLKHSTKNIDQFDPISAIDFKNLAN